MFELTVQQKELRKEIREYTDREIWPQVAALRTSQSFPTGIFRRLGDLGYLDLSFFHQPEGVKYSCIDSIIILEELARRFPSLSLSLSPHIQSVNLLRLFASERLKSTVVPLCLKGELLLGFAITEANGGSDVLNIDTLATHDGSGWILNGEKCWVTNAGAAGGYIVAAKSSLSNHSRDVSLFYVSADTPGLDDSNRMQMTGMSNSPLGQIRLDQCRIPEDCLIGEKDNAYRLIKILLNEGRLDMAAVAVGTAQGALECAVSHGNASRRYGRKLASYQGISFQTARMYERIFVARSTLYHVSSLFEHQETASMETAALKLFATETCIDVCRTAVHLLGAKGLAKNCDVEAYLCDSQMLTMAEGSSEVCQIIISDKLFHP